MAQGLIETIGMAGVVMFAAPVGLLGADFLLRGRPIQGAVFLGIAALMVLVPKYVKTPDDVAAEAVEDVAETVVKTDDEE